MLNGKATIILLTVGLIKKDIIHIKWVILEQYNSSKNKMKVKLNLPNYATKSDFKNATGVVTSNFAKKSDLASLKSDVYELDNDKLKNVPYYFDSLESKVCDVLKPIPTDLKKSSDVVYKKIVKKYVYGWIG